MYIAFNRTQNIESIFSLALLHTSCSHDLTVTFVLLVDLQYRIIDLHVRQSDLKKAST